MAAGWYDERARRIKTEREAGMLAINETITIPEGELTFSYARSGGPGGQNVNKVSSKAVLRWAMRKSAGVPAAARERIARLEGKRVTNEGELLVVSQRFRDQERNRADCLEKLREIVLRALVVPKPRKATKPTK